MTDQPHLLSILSDQPALEDQLDFAPYTKTMTSIIADSGTDTPLTIGVFASWSQGKTSLMRMVEQQLADAATLAAELAILALKIEASTRPNESMSSPQPGVAVYNINIQQATGLVIGDGAWVVQGGVEPGQASPGQASEVGSPWSPNAIRALLIAAFADEDLTTLCLSYFHSVYKEFPAGLTRDQKIQPLLDYCRRFEQIEELLARVKVENSAQYHRFEPHVRR